MSKEAMKLAKAWFERNTYGDEAVDVYEALCAALAEQPAQRTPAEVLDWLADQHRAQCGENRPIQEWIRKMKEALP